MLFDQVLHHSLEHPAAKCSLKTKPASECYCLGFIHTTVEAYILYANS